MKTATSTEVARRFGEILMEVKHGGEVLTITKNGEPVAQLCPVREPTISLEAFAAFWRKIESDPDDAFARDLERINRSDLPPQDPWA